MSDVIAGRIELLEPLARGASGSLWRAIDRRYGAVCAAKVMRQRDGAEVLRFVREQSVGSAQDLGRHPHLLPPYTWVAEDDTVVLVMPLAHGGTLAGVLSAHGALSPSLVAHLLRQLTDALAAMHESRWVHRDIKPANLLLAATGAQAPHLLMADFGIALHEGDVRLTETGLVHGTPGYMAPETLDGAAISFAQDVWAAAACAVEALAPSRPRERPAPEDLAERAGSALASSPDPAAPGLERLLRAMLDADPSRRPSATAARDTIPVLQHPAQQWSRTASGQHLVVHDQVEHVPGMQEVPLDGPSALSGLAPGLHERLHALSEAHRTGAPTPGTASAVPQRAAPSPGAPSPAGSTERFSHDPTRRAPQVHPSGADSPAGPAHPVAGVPESTAPRTPRSRARTVTGALLLLASLLAAAGSGTLIWVALS